MYCTKELIRRLWELSDFSAAFDVIDHNLLKRFMYYVFSTSVVLWIQNYLSNITQI
jgi:hypothetical protein